MKMMKPKGKPYNNTLIARLAAGSAKKGMKTFPKYKKKF